MKIRNNKVYIWCETGDWLLAGQIILGIDGHYIEWYA